MWKDTHPEHFTCFARQVCSSSADVASQQAPAYWYARDIPPEASPPPPATPRGFMPRGAPRGPEIPEPVTPERFPPTSSRHHRRGSSADDRPPAARAFARGPFAQAGGVPSFEAGTPPENGTIRMEDIGAPVCRST